MRQYLHGESSRACSRCSVPVKRELEVRASCSARSTTAFAFGENWLLLVLLAIALGGRH